jgi:hypothetical protein
MAAGYYCVGGKQQPPGRFRNQQRLTAIPSARWEKKSVLNKKKKEGSREKGGKTVQRRKANLTVEKADNKESKNKMEPNEH